MMLCKFRQYFCRIKSVKIINKGCSLTQPLSIELAPHCLCPSRIRYCKVQAIRVNIMPIFSRMEMPERILIAMHRNLGISRCSGCKEHQHCIVTASRILCSVKVSTKEGILFIKVSPALFLAVYHNFIHKLRAFLCRNINLIRNIALCGTYNCTNSRSIETIFKIMFQQLIHSGYCNRAKSVKTNCRIPELIMASEYKHYSIALFNAKRLKVIRRAARIFLHITERKYFCFFFIRNMYHCRLVRLFLCDFVNYIIREIKLLGIFKLN